MGLEQSPPSLALDVHRAATIAKRNIRQAIKPDPARPTYNPLVNAQAAETVLKFAERAGPELKGPDAKAAFGRLEEKYGDLLAAIQWFIGERRTDEGLRLANALYSFWITKQRFDEGSVWFDRILGSPGGDEARRGTAFIGAGFMAFWKGEDERASSLFGRALEIGRRLGDPPWFRGR